MKIDSSLVSKILAAIPHEQKIILNRFSNYKKNEVVIELIGVLDQPVHISTKVSFFAVGLTGLTDSETYLSESLLEAKTMFYYKKSVYQTIEEQSTPVMAKKAV